jgi:hypothetical protein
VVLVFVNQTITVGNGPPTDTAASLRVTRYGTKRHQTG